MLLDIRPDYLQIVRDILQKHVPQYEVWAFGSRAKWTAKEYSDLDLCIVSDKPLSFSLLGTIGDDFSESDLPWKVDVVDWATTSPSFRKIIERDKVVVQQRGNQNSGACFDVTVMPLEECLDALIDYRGKTPVKTTSGIPLITAKIIKGGRIEAPTEFIATDNFDSWMRRGMPKTGDVVLTVEAPLGEVAQLGPEKVALAQRVVTLRGKVGVLDNTYLLYYLQTEEMQSKLKARATGTTVLGIKQSELRKVELQLPPIEMQVGAAATLKALDEKITLLRETNATLEAIAQALFKSWFVNFDPVRAKAVGREPEGIPPEISALFPSEFEDSVLGELPKGWRVVSVGDVADVVKGKSYKSSELVESDTALVTLKSFTRGGGFKTDGFKGFSGSYKQEQVVKPGDCIVAYTDVTQQAEVIGRAAMVLPSSEHTTLVASLDVGIVRPKIEHLTTAFLYFLLRGERYVSHIFGYTSGTTVLHLAKEGLPTYQFILPPAPLLQKFEEVAIPMMEQMAGNYLQTIELASLRDTLLPRLISGKLSLEGTVA